MIPTPKTTRILKTATAWWVALLLIFVLAWAIRLGMAQGFVGLAAPPDAAANPDQIDYELLAHHWVTTGQYEITQDMPTARRTPGTSLHLAPAYLLLGRDWFVARLWFTFLSASTCLVVAWIATLIFGCGARGKSIAILASLGVAFHPAHAYPSMHFLSETPFMFWLAIAVGATLAAYQSRRGDRHAPLNLPPSLWDIVAGAAWGVGILTRPNLAAVVPAAIGIASLAWVVTRRPAHLKQVAFQLVFLALVLSPWVVRNAVVLDKPTLSTIGGHGLWGANNALMLDEQSYHRGRWIPTSHLRATLGELPTEEVAQDEAASARAKAFMREHADAMPALIGMKFRRLIEPFSHTPNKPADLAFGFAWLATAPLMLLGIAASLRKHFAQMVIVLLPIATLVPVTAVYYGSQRFRDAMVPLFVVLAATGLAWSWCFVTNKLGFDTPVLPDVPSAQDHPAMFTYPVGNDTADTSRRAA